MENYLDPDTQERLLARLRMQDEAQRLQEQNLRNPNIIDVGRRGSFSSGAASVSDAMVQGYHYLRAVLAQDDETMDAHLRDAKHYGDSIAALTNDSIASMLGQGAGQLATAIVPGVGAGALAGRVGLGAIGKTVAGMGGMSLATSPMTYGESVNTQMEFGVEGRDALDAAVGPALANTAIEWAPMAPVLGPINRLTSLRQAASKGKQSAIKELADQRGSILGAGAKAVGLEGVVGATQSAINLAGVDPEARGMDLDSPNALDRYKQAAIDEIISGGAYSGPLAMGAQAIANREADAYKAQLDQTPQPTPAPTPAQNTPTIDLDRPAVQRNQPPTPALATEDQPAGSPIDPFLTRMSSRGIERVGQPLAERNLSQAFGVSPEDARAALQLVAENEVEGKDWTVSSIRTAADFLTEMRKEDDQALANQMADGRERSQQDKLEQLERVLQVVAQRKAQTDQAETAQVQSMLAMEEAAKAREVDKTNEFQAQRQRATEQTRHQRQKNEEAQQLANEMANLREQAQPTRDMAYGATPTGQTVDMFTPAALLPRQEPQLVEAEPTPELDTTAVSPRQMGMFDQDGQPVNEADALVNEYAALFDTLDRQQQQELYERIFREDPMLARRLEAVRSERREQAMGATPEGMTVDMFDQGQTLPRPVEAGDDVINLPQSTDLTGYPSMFDSQGRVSPEGDAALAAQRADLRKKEQALERDTKLDKETAGRLPKSSVATPFRRAVGQPLAQQIAMAKAKLAQATHTPTRNALEQVVTELEAAYGSARDKMFSVPKKQLPAVIPTQQPTPSLVPDTLEASNAKKEPTVKTEETPKTETPKVDTKQRPVSNYERMQAMQEAVYGTTDWQLVTVDNLPYTPPKTIAQEKKFPVKKQLANQQAEIAANMAPLRDGAMGKLDVIAGQIKEATGKEVSTQSIARAIDSVTDKLTAATKPKLDGVRKVSDDDAGLIRMAYQNTIPSNFIGAVSSLAIRMDNNSPKPEQKPEPKPEPKTEPKTEQKPAPKPEPKPEPKSEQRPAPKPAPKPAQKKETDPEVDSILDELLGEEKPQPVRRTPKKPAPVKKPKNKLAAYLSGDETRKKGKDGLLTKDEINEILEDDSYGDIDLTDVDFRHSDSSQPPKGVALSTVQARVKELVDAHPGLANNGVTVEVVRRPESVYGKKAVQAAPGAKTAMGAYHAASKKLFIFADNLHTTADIDSTFRHEAYTHFGLNLFDPATKKKILERVLASRGVLGLRDAWKYVDDVYKGVSDLKKAEEVVAKMSEVIPSRLEKLVDWVKHNMAQILRSLGLLDKRLLTRKEVNDLIESMAIGVRDQTITQRTKPLDDGAQFRNAPTADPKPVANKSLLVRAVEAINKKLGSGILLPAAALIRSSVGVVESIEAAYGQPSDQRVTPRLKQFLQNQERKRKAWIIEYFKPIHDLDESSKAKVWDHFVHEREDLSNLNEKELAAFRGVRKAHNDFYDNEIRPTVEKEYQAALELVTKSPSYRRIEKALSKLSSIEPERWTDKQNETYGKLVDQQAKMLGKVRSQFFVEEENGEYKISASGHITRATNGKGTHSLKSKRKIHAPRVYDFNKITSDFDGFTASIRKRATALGMEMSEDQASAIYHMITDESDYGFRQYGSMVGIGKSGSEKARQVLLSKYPNSVFEGYINADIGSLIPVYAHRTLLHTEFVREFGPYKIDDDGKVNFVTQGDDLAKFLNKLKGDDRATAYRAISGALGVYGARGGSFARNVSTGFRFAAAVLFMPFVMLTSFMDMPFQITAGKTKAERKAAIKALRGIFGDMLTGKGRMSSSRQKVAFYNMGLLTDSMLEHTMGLFHDAQSASGFEGKINALTSRYYRGTGLQGWNNLMQFTALRGASIFLDDMAATLGTSGVTAKERAEAEVAFKKIGITPAEYKRWKAAGKPSVNDAREMSPEMERIADRVVDFHHDWQRSRALHATSGDIPWWGETPIGRMVMQFKRFFYAAGSHLFPKVWENIKDGNWKDASAQVTWLAALGTAVGMLGLGLRHAIQYGMATQILDNPVPPHNMFTRHPVDATLWVTGQAMTGATMMAPYLDIMDRGPTAIFDPTVWIPSVSLANMAMTRPQALVDNAIYAGAVYYGGNKVVDMVQKRRMKREKGLTN